VKYRPASDVLVLADYRIWKPPPGGVLDFEATIEFYLRRLQGVGTTIGAGYADPYQMARTIQSLQNAGIWVMEYPQTSGNLTMACAQLYARLNTHRLKFYPASDLRQHVLNVTAVESSRGTRLAKEKSSLKIDAAAALSFAIAAAEKYGQAPPADYAVHKRTVMQLHRSGFRGILGNYR
jgi:phage terminase large subunit-like protein